MSKKSEAIRSLLSAFGDVIDMPSPENRAALDHTISATVGGLSNGDVDYLRARLDSLADDIRQREDADPRSRFLEDVQDLWKR